MINPDTIAAEIIARALSIPTMTTVLANGFAYHSEADGGSREKAIDGMSLNKALMTYEGTIASQDNGGFVYQHDFRIFVRLSSLSFGSFLALFHDGVPALGGAGLKMIYTNIPSVAEVIELSTATPVIGKDFADYLELYITILDRQG